MDYVIKLSDKIDDYEGYVEVLRLSDRFDGKTESLDKMVKIENRLIQDLYKMTLSDLIRILSESSAGGENISTPILPQNCIKHVWVNRAAKQHEVYIEIPKRRWDITYHSQAFEKVGFPRMIFKYSVSDTKVILSNIVAVQEQVILTDETPLFLFPFSNVNTDTKVCMGGNELPPIKTLSQLSTFHNIFFAAPFGDDYGSKTSNGKTIRELFTVLKDNDFNDEWLVPLKESILGNF